MLPVEEIARLSLAEIQTRIKEEDNSSIRKLNVASHVTERGSCARAKSEAAK